VRFRNGTKNAQMKHHHGFTYTALLHLSEAIPHAWMSTQNIAGDCQHQLQQQPANKSCGLCIIEQQQQPDKKTRP